MFSFLVFFLVFFHDLFRLFSSVSVQLRIVLWKAWRIYSSRFGGDLLVSALCIENGTCKDAVTASGTSILIKNEQAYKFQAQRLRMRHYRLWT